MWCEGNRADNTLLTSKQLDTMEEKVLPKRETPPSPKKSSLTQDFQVEDLYDVEQIDQDFSLHQWSFPSKIVTQHTNNYAKTNSSFSMMIILRKPHSTIIHLLFDVLLY